MEARVNINVHSFTMLFSERYNTIRADLFLFASPSELYDLVSTNEKLEYLFNRDFCVNAEFIDVIEQNDFTIDFNVCTTHLHPFEQITPGLIGKSLEPNYIHTRLNGYVWGNIKIITK